MSGPLSAVVTEESRSGPGAPPDSALLWQYDNVHDGITPASTLVEKLQHLRAASNTALTNLMATHQPPSTNADTNAMSAAKKKKRGDGENMDDETEEGPAAASSSDPARSESPSRKKPKIE